MVKADFTLLNFIFFMDYDVFSMAFMSFILTTQTLSFLSINYIVCVAFSSANISIKNARKHLWFFRILSFLIISFNFASIFWVLFYFSSEDYDQVGTYGINQICSNLISGFALFVFCSFFQKLSQAPQVSG